MSASIAMPWGRIKPRTPVLDFGDPINQGLLSHWALHENAGGRVGDLMKKNPGVFTNSPAWRSGRHGPCIGFSGTAFVDIAPSGKFALADTTFTVSFWLRADSSSLTNQYLISCIDAGLGTGWAFGINSVTGDHKLQVLTKQATTAQCSARASNSVVDTTEWVFGAAVITTSTASSAANDIQVYVNGQLDQGTITRAGGVYVGSVTTLKLGARDLGNTFAGRLDNVRIHGRALTPREIQRLYMEPFAGLVTSRRRVSSPQVSSIFIPIIGRGPGMALVGSRGLVA